MGVSNLEGEEIQIFYWLSKSKSTHLGIVMKLDKDPEKLDPIMKPPVIMLHHRAR